MSIHTFYKAVAILIALVLLFEISVLSDMIPLTHQVYSSIHMLFVAFLLFTVVKFYVNHKTHESKYVVMGMFFTAIGDFVNCTISPIPSIFDKLSIALFLFGTGYSLYNFAMLPFVNTIISKSKFNSYKYILLIPMLLFAGINFVKYVYPHVSEYKLLLYGTTFFTFVIYGFMLLFAFWYLLCSHYNLQSIIIFIAVIFISYSDAVIFNSWLNEDKLPTISQYALNFILYFSGQALFALFPSFTLHSEK